MGLAGVSCSADPCLSVRIAELPTGSSRQSAAPAKANKLFYENATGHPLAKARLQAAAMPSRWEDRQVASVERAQVLPAICGLLAGPVLLVGTVAGALAQPDEFSIVDHDNSDLGAATADSPWLSNQLGSNLPGLLLLVFAIGLGARSSAIVRHRRQSFKPRFDCSHSIRSSRPISFTE